MTDKEKIEAIRAEIHRLVHVNGYSKEMANDLFAYMNSLPNEPVSEDLEEAATYNSNRFVFDGNIKSYKLGFVEGANWQKEQTINKACEWLKDLNNGHEVMSFTDSHYLETDELIDYFKNYMED